ncbi:hypothetical protein [uncultured Desulfovibrio sp.]
MRSDAGHARPLVPSCCPICGRALRCVFGPDGPHWVCPLCGVVEPPA